MKKGSALSWIIIGVLLLVIIIGIWVYSYSYSATPSSGNANQQAKSPTGSDININIKDFAFDPSSTTINVGDRVIWTNSDSVEHSIISNNGEFSSGNLLTAATFSYVFSKAGTYKYHCGIHSSMQGTVIVR